MNDHVAIIGQHPFGLQQPFQAMRQFMRLAFDGKPDFLRNGLDLALVGAGADHEIVGERSDPGQIQNFDVARFLGFRRTDCDKPGGDADFIRLDFVRIGWSRVRLSQNTLLCVSYYSRGPATGPMVEVFAPPRTHTYARTERPDVVHR